MATTKITTAAQLAERMLDVAKNYKTLYVMGGIGSPMNEYNKQRYIKHHEYNARLGRTAMINAATADTFGFDCVCLIKALLWGWSADKSDNNGGTIYKSNGVPDINADQMIAVCKDISTDFSNIDIGEAVWMSGHIGVYIGNGLAVECTPAWDNCVQVTACNCSKSGYNRRDWTKHGKLPYVTYAEKQTITETASADLKVGDVVTFTGTKHYATSGSATAKACKGGKAKVTAIREGAKHPYHLVKVAGDTATVYGWVDAADISEIASVELKVGDVVTFTGTKHYATSGSTAAKACKGGKAKVTAIREGAKHPYHLVKVAGDTATVYGWVDAADIKQ